MNLDFVFIEITTLYQVAMIEWFGMRDPIAEVTWLVRLCLGAVVLGTAVVFYLFFG